MEQVNKCLISPTSAKSKIPLLKVALAGESEVGKTTLISTFVNESPTKENFKKSVGVSSSLKNIFVKNKEVRLDISDTAGDEKLRTWISTYYRGVHGIILVFDMSNVNSFYFLKNWLREIKQFAPENCIKYLVCNKVDKVCNDTTNNSSNLIISEEEIDKFAKQNGLKYLKTSALSNIGVRNIFESITYDILESIDQETLLIRSESFKISGNNFKRNSNNFQHSCQRNIKSNFNCCHVI